jgi:ATP-dependent RNA helicase DDX10/DBP4
MATSRKALAKKSAKGTKLVFDDEGNAHSVAHLTTEEEFLAQGLPEEQKRKFVEETATKMRMVDQEDYDEAKEKRRQKKLKRGATLAEDDYSE